MTKILTTVGRVVWFSPSRLTGDGRFAHIDGRKPLAPLPSSKLGGGLAGRHPTCAVHEIVQTA